MTNVGISITILQSFREVKHLAKVTELVKERTLDPKLAP